jgi:threonine 3-dehydrogenase
MRPALRCLSRGLSTQSRPTTRVLVTGATGQIGMELVAVLRARLAGRADSLVLASDIKGDSASLGGAEFTPLDVTDAARLQALCSSHRIDTVVHLASLLSATGERDPDLAMHVNRGGAEAVLNTARALKLKVFAPSTIAAFGPSTPQDNTPDLTVMRPTTMYGVTKVYLELLGEYYAAKFGVDFRSVRYPGILSHKALPGGGTTDYAVEIFYEALQKGAYTSFIAEHTALPMMYMPDALDAAVGLLEAPAAALTQRVYNVTGCSFTPGQLGAAVSAELVAMGRAPLAMAYKPDFRQKIAESWPRSLDDSPARRDWGWAPKFGTQSMTKDMLGELAKRLLK